jgi:glycosyltransferase involved in cell wall biosynthesis
MKHQLPPRALLVISAEVKRSVQPDIAAGRFPRKDYFELEQALDADLLDWIAIDTHASARLLKRVAGTSIAHAWLAFRQRRSYQVIYTDSERVGIPLTALLKLARARNRHVMLAHLLSPWKKRVWFRWGHIQSHIAAILCHSSLQRRIMIEELGIPAEKIVLLPYQVDEHFWRPMPAQEAQAALSAAPGSTAASDTASAPTRPGICSVGLEYRDYPTLVEAVRGLDVQLEIAAASYWSTHSGMKADESLPPNVHVSSHQYLSLRHLYASSRLVVVPLFDVPNQAGITSILEAMAMGKAVIVSGTRGQTDTIRDRRNNGFGRIEREVLPGFLEAPGVEDALRHLPTGFYVKPGDAAELRQAISYLLAHPEVADELGRNGRRVFENLMTLDMFTARIVQVIKKSALSVTPFSQS